MGTLNNESMKEIDRGIETACLGNSKHFNRRTGGCGYGGCRPPIVCIIVPASAIAGSVREHWVEREDEEPD